MEQVLNKVVWHTVFGRGTVIAADERYFTVEFEDNAVGDKEFIFPSAFETVLSFEDGDLQAGARDAATQAALVSADYSKQILDRCAQEAEIHGKMSRSSRTTRARKTPAKKKK